MKTKIFILIMFLLTLLSVIKVTIQTKFQMECLTTTNKYRNKHHAPPLKYDKKIKEVAKKRCLEVASPNALDGGHESPDDYGENIYRSTAKSVTNCALIIDKWYNEVKDYSFKSPSFSTSTAHFIQLVWKSSTLVGCARCDANGIGGYHLYFICNYKEDVDKSVAKLKANVLKA